MGKYFVFLLIFILLCCTSSPPKKVDIVFYYWQSRFSLDSLENHYLKVLNTQKIYVKAFDVDWDEHEKRALPLSELTLNNSWFPPLEFIPTVFITNRTMINLSAEKIEALGDQIMRKIRLKWKVFNWASPKEIQLDCDWSSQSRRNYFHLIDHLRKRHNLQVTTTVRLHQFKYPLDTGVPPANQGILMVYNMGDLNDPNEKNSILNLKTAAQYLNNVPKYPLKLQVALPLFSWGVLKRRGKVIALIPQIKEKARSVYFRSLSETDFVITKSHYFGELYLYEGDQLRQERVNIKELKETVRLIRRNLDYDSLELCFYHLDQDVLEDFSTQDLKDIQAILQD